MSLAFWRRKRAVYSEFTVLGKLMKEIGVGRR